ncbi:hypothetical protein NJG13_22630, partial [Stenotrophomonas maltophilia]
RLPEQPRTHLIRSIKQNQFQGFLLIQPPLPLGLLAEMYHPSMIVIAKEVILNRILGNPRIQRDPSQILP